LRAGSRRSRSRKRATPQFNGNADGILGDCDRIVTIHSIVNVEFTTGKLAGLGKQGAMEFLAKSTFTVTKGASPHFDTLDRGGEVDVPKSSFGGLPRWGIW
jgi:hypothetical protein